MLAIKALRASNLLSHHPLFIDKMFGRYTAVVPVIGWAISKWILAAPFGELFPDYCCHCLSAY
jgi:hypothetical protein